MASGIDFAGNGGEDTSSGPISTGQPQEARRGAQGPIEMTGDGAMDTKGAIDTSPESGSMPPKGGDDIVFAGEGKMDL